MDETQRFIKSLRYYPLTSQQRKTLRGQTLAGDLAGAKAGLQRITHKRKGSQEGTVRHTGVAYDRKRTDPKVSTAQF